MHGLSCSETCGIFQTRDWTCILCISMQILNHWTTMEVPDLLIFFMGFTSFLGGSVLKNLPANSGNTGLIPGLGRSSGEGNGNLLQCSCWEKSHGQRSLVGYSPWGLERIRHDLATKQWVLQGQDCTTAFDLWPLISPIVSFCLCVLVQFCRSVVSDFFCDPIDCSTPGFPVHHQLLELA